MNKQKLESLQRFIVNNEALESLEAKLKEFNPLNVLKVDSYEIRHSNILAWLLNPSENHKLNDIFLKKILSEVLVNNEQIDSNLTAFKCQSLNFYDFKVFREEFDIDILLISELHNIVIIIENKIHSNESKGQLDKYYNKIKNRYKDYEIIPVYLTIYGDEPSNTRYGILSYLQVLSILNFILSLNKDNLSAKVYDFIAYYLKVLEKLTMEDEDVKELCKKIYKEHKEALDLIYEYAWETQFEAAGNEFLSTINTINIYTDGRTSWFLPNQLALQVEKVAIDSWCSGYPIAYWFNTFDEKIAFIIEVGPFKDIQLRQDFLNHLKDYEFKIHDYSFKDSAKYTRIFTKYPKFSDWDNKDSIIQIMEDLYHVEAKKINEKLLEACKTFVWEKEDNN